MLLCTSFPPDFRFSSFSASDSSLNSSFQHISQRCSLLAGWAQAHPCIFCSVDKRWLPWEASSAPRVLSEERSWASYCQLCVSFDEKDCQVQNWEVASRWNTKSTNILILFLAVALLTIAAALISDFPESNIHSFYTIYMQSKIPSFLCRPLPK